MRQRDAAFFLREGSTEVAAQIHAEHTNNQQSAKLLAEATRVVDYARKSPRQRDKMRADIQRVLEWWRKTDEDFRAVGILDTEGKVLMANEAAYPGAMEMFFAQQPPELYSFVSRGLDGNSVVSDLHFAYPAAECLPPDPATEAELEPFMPTIAYVEPIRAE